MTLFSARPAAVGRHLGRSALVAIGLSGALGGWELMRRPAPPPVLAPAEMAQALRLVRAVTEAAAAGKSGPVESGPEFGSLRTTGPVFVTRYGPERADRVEPSVGHWLAAEGEPARPLGEALRLAARDLAVRLRAARGAEARPLGTTFKVDVAGPSRRLWLKTPWYLAAVLDPGQDGLAARRGSARAFRLPAWAVEHGRSPADAVRELTREVGGAPSLASYRTLAFVEGPSEEPGPRPVYRGNVLYGELTTDRLRRSLLEAALYLARSIDGDGRYCYLYDWREDRCGADYNLLRHAGTTYSLYQLYGVLQRPELLGPAERATEWLRRQVRWVDDDRAFVLEGDLAKLGAVALTVLDLLEREQVLGDGRDRRLLTALGAFMLSQQREDGHLPSLFAWRPGLAASEWNSIYYAGEALLALVRLHRLEPDRRYSAAALLGARYLVERRWSWGGLELLVPPDAWLAQALAELDVVSPASWMRDYALRIVEVMELTMLRQAEGAAPDLVGGPASGFAFPGVTPAGSRNEAITAVWRMVRRRGERETARRLRELALAMARFSLSQQFGPANSYFLPDPARARGGFRDTALGGSIRIDSVQHNVTGLLGVLAMLEEGP